MRQISLSALLALTLTVSGYAPSLAANAGSDAARTDSPYAGQQLRAIKALSPQQIDDYLNGRGLGYAKAAELNHYPGPRHVLDLAGELNLTTQQIDESQALFATMQAAAIDLGKRLVTLEGQLDQRFASASVEEGSLRVLLEEIAALEARLRFVHLSAHLEQRTLLTAHQVRLYDRLRGYADGVEHGHTHTH